jgi:hypothetical protein
VASLFQASRWEGEASIPGLYTVCQSMLSWDTELYCFFPIRKLCFDLIVTTETNFTSDCGSHEDVQIYSSLHPENIFFSSQTTWKVKYWSTDNTKNGKEWGNSYRRMKRPAVERHTQIHRILFDIFWWSQMSFSIRRE